MHADAFAAVLADDERPGAYGRIHWPELFAAQVPEAPRAVEARPPEAPGRRRR